MNWGWVEKEVCYLLPGSLKQVFSQLGVAQKAENKDANDLRNIKGTI